MGGLRVEFAVHCHDAAESRYWIAGQRLAIGFYEACALGDAAWIGVLHNNARRHAPRVKLGDAFVCRVGIVDVVVRERFALNLPRGGDARPLFARAIERRRLMWIFAVSQVGYFGEFDEFVFR